MPPNNNNMERGREGGKKKKTLFFAYSCQSKAKCTKGAREEQRLCLPESRTLFLVVLVEEKKEVTKNTEYL